MAFVAKSFIGDASALADGTTEGRGVDSRAEQVQQYLTDRTPAGSAGAREIKIACSSLNGDRVFVLVTIEE